MARSLLHDELSYRIRGRRHTSKSKNGHGHRQNRRHPARCHRIIVFGCTTNSASRHSKSLARILSTAPLQRNVSAQHHLLLLGLIITLGGITVVAYFRSQSPLDCEFATHKIHGKVQPLLDRGSAYVASANWPESRRAAGPTNTFLTLRFLICRRTNTWWFLPRRPAVIHFMSQAGNGAERKLTARFVLFSATHAWVPRVCAATLTIYRDIRS